MLGIIQCSQAASFKMRLFSLLTHALDFALGSLVATFRFPVLGIFIVSRWGFLLDSSTLLTCNAFLYYMGGLPTSNNNFENKFDIPLFRRAPDFINNFEK